MRCPKCTVDDDKVVDSRSSRRGDSIRRRRECVSCGFRFTTYETIEQEMPAIIKRGGGTEPFERQKLLGGMIRSCEKRPVAQATLERAADEITEDLLSAGLREIPSRAIGAMVLTKLGEIDKVARIRYASVYRDFQNVGDFIDEVEGLATSKLPPGLQPELFEPKSAKTAKTAKPS